MYKSLLFSILHSMYCFHSINFVKTIDMRKFAKFNGLTVGIYAKKSKALQNGSCPIYIRIGLGKEQAEFSSKLTVAPNSWDSKKCLVKGTSPEAVKINRSLQLAKTNLLQIYDDLVFERKEITLTKIKARYLGEDTGEEAKLIEYFTLFNQKVLEQVGTVYAHGTYKKFKSTLNHLTSFVQDTFKKKDISFALVSNQFVSQFQNYLRIDKNCCNNTTVKYMKTLKRIVLLAVDDKLLSNDPYKGVRFKQDEVEARFLDDEELQRLVNTPINGERMSMVRDAFALSCYTGLAYIDLKDLKKKDIVEHQGVKLINKRRQKTNILSSIPIFPPAQKIIDKYQDHPICLHDGVVIPVMSNQRMNIYLKEIAHLCGIDCRLSTHVARHTFATTIALSNGLPQSVTSKILGHTSTRMTDRYSHMRNSLMVKSTRELHQLLS